MYLWGVESLACASRAMPRYVYLPLKDRHCHNGQVRVGAAEDRLWGWYQIYQAEPIRSEVV